MSPKEIIFIQIFLGLGTRGLKRKRLFCLCQISLAKENFFVLVSLSISMFIFFTYRATFKINVPVVGGTAMLTITTVPVIGTARLADAATEVAAVMGSGGGK